MGNILALLLLVLSLLLNGCDIKSSSSKETASQNTHQNTPNNKQNLQNGKSRTFVLKDIDERDLNITMNGENMRFENVKQPFVLINLFATWCPPCKAELPDINQLQKEHFNELFVVGILINDRQNSTQLRQFMKQHKINYFISYANDNDIFAKAIIEELGLRENISIPLSLLYKNGRLFRYYEGAIPLEMLENELDQARKKDS